MKKGFTLLELLLVCVLLTLLIAITQPKLSSHYHKMKEKYELDKFLGFLNYAVEYSYIKQGSIKVCFNEEPCKITIKNSTNEVLKELETSFIISFEEDYFIINKGRIKDQDFYLLLESDKLSKELKLTGNEITLIDYL